ncbi:RluA family pseudouridine synthase [Haliangium sp.]|uniref:RluA family pseudouridine synthase n=1 Tax=Haliangium sp. TaxID=2663208 RepID=UPI003D0D7291
MTGQAPEQGGEVRRYRFEPAAGEEARPRLDHFLAERAPTLTRSQIKRLIDDGLVAVDEVAATKPGRKLSPGEQVVVRLPPPAPVVAEPQAMDLVVLYEDEHIIVVDKPAGLVVHPAPGHPDRTLVNALLHHCHDLSGIGGALRPGIVHRLDRDTSGVMVATKSDPAHVALARTFAAHAIEREYVAFVAPPPARAQGTHDTLHGRHPVHRKKFSARVTRGKRAVTHWRVEVRYGAVAARVRCRLETGRTHQIRVHMADLGAPLIADSMYGRRPRGGVLAPLVDALGRHALHAAVLGFAHPITAAALRFESPLPADLQALAEALAALPGADRGKPG